jgi:hypothetical protein
MRAGLARLLVRLYPAEWRERYAEEFAAMLEMERGNLPTLGNSILGAVSEHLYPTQGGGMEQQGFSLGSILRKPSAFLPLAMSVVALAIVLVAIVIGLIQHSPRDTDEGAVAHLWQLLMTVQMPIVLYFAIKWLRRAPGQTLRVLAMQAGAWLASCAPVYFLHL